ncbi:hypothetical protein CDAR_403291 [Caerostris darwini]|uniref:Uncharacterized protein n=1 Tax=Caerostris darwini TaxID=1538125 RepID=A0AAV4S856_9ARAC|nr:hypothetical protein CDAR_403291 [Caerostris darwini]
MGRAYQYSRLIRFSVRTPAVQNADAIHSSAGLLSSKFTCIVFTWNRAQRIPREKMKSKRIAETLLSPGLVAFLQIQACFVPEKFCSAFQMHVLPVAESNAEMVDCRRITRLNSALTVEASPWWQLRFYFGTLVSRPYETLIWSEIY